MCGWPRCNPPSRCSAPDLALEPRLGGCQQLTYRAFAHAPLHLALWVGWKVWAGIRTQGRARGCSCPIPCLVLASPLPSLLHARLSARRPPPCALHGPSLPLSKPLGSGMGRALGLTTRDAWPPPCVDKHAAPAGHLHMSKTHRRWGWLRAPTLPRGTGPASPHASYWEGLWFMH